MPTRVSNGKRFSCPTGQRDKRPLIVPGQRRQREKEFHSSRDKGTSGQAQNLATGRDGPGFFEAVQFRPGASCGTKLPSILPNNAVFRTKNKKNLIFFLFVCKIEPICHVGRPGTEDLVPGFLLLLLSHPGLSRVTNELGN